MGFLLDTSALIDIFVNRKSAPQIKAYVADKEFFVSSLTIYEINKAKTVDSRIDIFLKGCNLLNLTLESMKRSADIFKKLQEKGKMINELDILIAGIAVEEGLVLITKDGDFEKITEIEATLQTKIFQ